MQAYKIAHKSGEVNGERTSVRRCKNEVTYQRIIVTKKDVVDASALIKAEEREREKIIEACGG